MTAQDSARQRYSDAYKGPRELARAGNCLTVAAILLALMILAIGISLDGPSQIFIMFFIFASIVALMGVGIGGIIKGQAKVLEATLDNAVNTSSFLAADDRRDLLSLTTESPWSQVGIGSLKLNSPVEKAALRGWDEQRPYESPVEFLIAANHESLRSPRPISSRLHRQLTRRR